MIKLHKNILKNCCYQLKLNSHNPYDSKQILNNAKAKWITNMDVKDTKPKPNQNASSRTCPVKHFIKNQPEGNHVNLSKIT